MRSPLLLSSVTLVIAIAASCRTSPTEPPPRAIGGCTPKASSSAAPTASASASHEAAEPSARLPFEPDRGCAGDVDDARPALAQLDAMGSSCVHGFARAEGVVANDGEGVEVKLDAFACVRFGLASDTRGAAVAAVLTDAGGRELARQEGRLPMMVGPGGPVCVGEAGSYVLRWTHRGPRGQVQTAAWIASR